MIENVKLRQIIAENNFPGIFQQKENFSENLTSSCHGNTFVGVTSKSGTGSKNRDCPGKIGTLSRPAIHWDVLGIVAII